MTARQEQMMAASFKLRTARRLVVGVLAVVAAPACAASTLRPASDPPNVILIMADDLGYAELGSYGQEKILTPHLDRMAREGMRFTRFYSGHPVCAPSRAALMTGLHTGHAPVRGNHRVADRGEGNFPLPPGTQTIASILQDHGYATAAVGKWGLGGPGPTGKGPGLPSDHGFDRFYGYLDQSAAHNYYPTHLWIDTDRGLFRDTLRNLPFSAHQRLEGDPNDPASYAGFAGQDYAPDLMTEQALDFIRDNRNRPFFLYLPYTIPHAALQVPDEELNQYSFAETPYRGENGYLPHPRPHAAYAGMISRLDGYVGRVFALLEELELDQNTLVIFTSDNGATYNGGTDPGFFNSVGPLRGLKNSVYEGGIRVPMIARWPGRIEPGSTSDHVSANWDVLPTLAELTGATAPEEIDGISFLPTLLGRPADQEEHSYLYWENHGPCKGEQAVRMGDWKGVRMGIHAENPGSIELYDLASDIGETRDVAMEHPEVVRRIRRVMRTAHTPAALPQWNIDLSMLGAAGQAEAAATGSACTHPSLGG